MPRILIERDLPAVMRDGVTLRADIYRLETDDRLPVLLTRTPYGKAYNSNAFCMIAAERGYAVVNQDTRGRWASDGENYPFIHEKEDGWDTLEWITQQTWSNGKVGMFGGSYVGYTQFAAASTHHPALKTIIPFVSFLDPLASSYTGGALQLGATVSWGLMAWAMMAIMKFKGSAFEQMGMMGELIDMVDGMHTGETFRTLPLADLPLIGREGSIPVLWETYDHQPGDSYWSNIILSPKDITIPALHFGGWYDLFTSATLGDSLRIRREGNPNQKVIMGPWLHGSLDSLVGEVDFGMSASPALLLPDEIQLRWFNGYLKGSQTELDEAPYQIFVMGINQWRSENEWPLNRTKYTDFYLHSSGSSALNDTSGSLSRTPPNEEPVDNYLYDPRDPTPTRGGGACCWPAGISAGAYDQRAVEARPDVLVYTSDILENDLEVTGPVEAVIWAASSAVCTDFTAKLVDVAPCGFARNVCDGISRTNMTPGNPQEVMIKLNPTSNVFKAGHRVRLEIASANFPRFDRNPNTGCSTLTSAETCPALQTILHDAGHPSRIILPVILA